MLGLAVLAAAPATSSAAVIFQDDSGGLTYRAGLGEANHLTMDPFAGPIEDVSTSSMFIADSGATLTPLDDFCLPGPPLQCPTVAFTAFMGDRDDHGEAIPFFRDAEIWGQGGDDDLQASGRDHARAFGGPGDDTMSIGADGDAEGYGQSGADTISAGTQSSLHLFGGDGPDDLSMVTSVFAPSIMDGGAGRDTIAADGSASLLDVFGGPGDDRISGHGAMHGGAGDDRIDVSGGGGDTVACGPGFDRVIADAADSVGAGCERVTIVS
jgi:hypothetical protein